MTTNKISAVFDTELEKVLVDLNLWDDIQQKNLKCYFCQNLITLENIQYILPIKNKIRIGCNKPKCVLKISFFTKNAF
ncbi:MAG: hypothetical protein WC741_00565 [Patescibacteria group bacterium]|jgi:hypothetical protein